MKYITKASSLLLILLLFSVVEGQIPNTINYQGKLTDPEGVALEGLMGIKFTIYNAPAGPTALWSDSFVVDISHGLFDVVLGPIPLDFDEPYWMELKVESEVLAPRQPLNAVPYSIYSNRSMHADSSRFAQHAITADTAGSVHWVDIFSMPAGFADGVDNTGSGSDYVHNDLRDIQGGIATQRYHLTSIQHTDLTDFGNCSQHKHDQMYFTRDTLGSHWSPGGSGASLIGVFDNLDNSDAVNIQDVLGDFDAILSVMGDITAVYADNGLTGTATSGDAHLNVGTGWGILVNADDVEVDTLTLDARYVNVGEAALGALSGTYPGPDVDYSDSTGAVDWDDVFGRPGDNDFIRNQYSSAQGSANFWIDGDGKVAGGNFFVDSPSYPGRTFEIRCGGRQEVHTANDYVTYSSGHTEFRVGTAFGSNQDFYITDGAGVKFFAAEGDDQQVGIGTTNPASKLSINGVGSVEYGVFIQGPATSVDDQAALHIESPKFSSSPGSYTNYYGIFVNQEQPGNAFLKPRAIMGQMTGVTDGYCTGVFGSVSGTGTDGGRAYGVKGYAGGCSSGYNYGVYGYLTGTRNGAGVYGSTTGDVAVGAQYAGYFSGNVHVAGTLTKSGGAFMIDHPADPANKNLVHSFVESPDMKNIYDGVVVLDENGEAWVELPEYFEMLNKDFRYQLTCLGKFASVYIAEEISGSKFKIAGGVDGMKVSWQVTGTRHDPWANEHRIEPVQEKEEKGVYLNPELYLGVQRTENPGIN